MNVELRKLVRFRVLNESLAQAIVDASQAVLSLPESFSLSIVVVSDREIQKINKSYRKKDAPTDVLSFQYDDNSGEIILSADRIRAQARELRHSITAETVYLIIHGIVHIAGWDHERSEEEARKMRSIEHKIFHQCGLD